MSGTSDIVIHGGGLAGSAAAILLARAGRRVVQHVDVRHRGAAPPEILSPWSRMLLERLSLPEPRGAVVCDGVLSLWGGDEPDLHDYVLTTTRHGLALDRGTFHVQLGEVALAAGVTRVGRGAGRPTGIAPNAYELIASGRSSTAPRRFDDRLVALIVPCRDDHAFSRLLIEPVEDGWWYLPPQVGAIRYAVFVTDPAMMPPSLKARRGWLRAALEDTRLVGPEAREADFTRVSGMDARVAAADAPTSTCVARLGDAALSLDPLSGAGMARALEGVVVIVEDILEHGRAAGRYRQWFEMVDEHERALRAEIYSLAAARFPNAPFWERRLASIDGRPRARAA